MICGLRWLAKICFFVIVQPTLIKTSSLSKYKGYIARPLYRRYYYDLINAQSKKINSELNLSIGVNYKHDEIIKRNVI